MPYYFQYLTFCWNTVKLFTNVQKVDTDLKTTKHFDFVSLEKNKRIFNTPSKFVISIQWIV